MPSTWNDDDPAEVYVREVYRRHLFAMDDASCDLRSAAVRIVEILSAAPGVRRGVSSVPGHEYDELDDLCKRVASARRVLRKERIG